MASTSSGPSCAIIFTTQTAYPLPTQKYMIPMNWKRFQLSQLVNKALSLPEPVPFDFLIRGEVLRTNLAEWCSENGVGEEETLEVEYIESVMPPQKMTEIPHEDWVSSVTCSIPGHFVTVSYDGYLRAFDYSKNSVFGLLAHSAPITSVCAVSRSSNEDKPHLIATASQDQTAQLVEVSFSTDHSQKTEPRSLAKLHLHTAPVSSVASNESGSHVLTSSWDALIGLWDTSIPDSDEVPEPAVPERERKKRRKLNGTDAENKPRRKAPVAVLKSHTARVSRVTFGQDKHTSMAFSCGHDSTVRLWDVENGVCTQTISTSEKPFLDLTLTADGNAVAAASTDRTITLYDIRSNNTANVTASVGSLSHPVTPSCVASGSTAHQIISGAYDGVARLWDLRSTKAAMASFKAWDGRKKILTVDWKRGIVGIGGEGGLEIWKAAEDTRSVE
ncbi:ribosome biogenesis protein ytm1 [Marasmius sp. AFHP31]|nr:ribosome biogenesis protein ytm1 [Marasmius sp. AFHP31]